MFVTTEQIQTSEKVQGQNNIHYNFYIFVDMLTAN